MAKIPEVILNDGNTIPQLGFGVFKIAPEDTKRVVLEAFEAGYRHIDTAAIYGNEAEVGAAIAESGLAREDLFITTKLWNDRHMDAPAAFGESLDKLGLDYVDLYLIHWPAQVQNLYVEAWKDMEIFKKAGMAKSIGVSNFHGEHLAQLEKANTLTPAVNQIELHPCFGQKKIVRATLDRGIAIEAWSPLGQGGYDLTALEPVASCAEKYGKTPAQIVLRWHIDNGRIIFPKTMHRERMRENMDIFDFELSDSEIKAIDALDMGEAGRQGNSIHDRGV